MFSWEIVQLRNMSCLIGILCPKGGVSVDWAVSFTNMDKPALWDPMLVRGFPFGEGRTNCAYECLNRGYQWLFFLDSDIICPKNTIPRLMSHRLPIVSALYHQRFPTWTGVEAEYQPCIFRETVDAEGKRSMVAITDYAPGSLVEADLVPGGCLLIHRSVLEKFIASGIKRIFEWTLTAENPQGKSEDFEFSVRARSLGYKCMVDTGIICTHETDAQIGLKGLKAKV